jgi:hypothetical protein
MGRSGAAAAAARRGFGRPNLAAAAAGPGQLPHMDLFVRVYEFRIDNNLKLTFVKSLAIFSPSHAIIYFITYAAHEHLKNKNQT